MAAHGKSRSLFIYSLASRGWLLMSTVAWVGSVLAIQRLVTLREDIAELGYTPETWRSWKQLWFALRIFFAFAMLALFALLVAAAVAGDALKHALP